MNLKEYLKDKNVLTIDVWTLIVLILLFPLNQISKTVKPIPIEAVLITPTTVSTLIGSIIITTILCIILIIFIVLCSRLRDFRYLDIYRDCKKLKSKTLKYIMIAIYIFEFLTVCTIFYIISLSELLNMILPIILTFIIIVIDTILIFKFNNSKDLKSQNI